MLMNDIQISLSCWCGLLEVSSKHLCMQVLLHLAFNVTVDT